MALNSAQKRKAREKLAKKRGVSASSISDSDLTSAITQGIIAASDFSSYDSGSSSSSYDSGSSSSSSSDSGCSW